MSVFKHCNPCVIHRELSNHNNETCNLDTMLDSTIIFTTEIDRCIVCACSLVSNRYNIWLYLPLAPPPPSSDSTKKPGPGSHSPEKVTATQRSPPKYSMGVRHSEYMCPLIIEVSD